MRLSRARIQDAVVVSAIYLATVLSPRALIRPPPLLLDALFFAVPSLYLIARRKKNLPKIILATALIGALTASMDIYLLHAHAWQPYKSSFSWHILGSPPEEFLWFFLHVFYIIVFYEHFIDDEAIARPAPRTRRLFLVSAFTLAVAFFLVSFLGDASRIPYAYLVVGSAAMLPALLYLLLARARFARKLAPLVIYFFFYTLIMEIQAVRFGLWSFADTQNYVGLITLFGAAFPVEEVIFWMLSAPAVAVVYYEFFIDDGR